MTGYAPSEVKAAHFAPLAVTDYVSEVEALRCMAMTGVVALHCRLLPFGWTGVWVFYVISGFAITSSLLASDRTSRSKLLLLRNFYASGAFAFGRSILIVIPSIIAAAVAGYDILQEYWPWMVTFTASYYDIFHFNIVINNWVVVGSSVDH